MSDLTLFPADIAEMSVSQLAALSPEQKREVDKNLDAAIDWLKKARTKFDAALDQCYGEQARAALRESGRDFGTAHISDGPLHIKFELPKKVSWNQQQLTEIAERIVASGDKVEGYLDVKLSVPESRYTNWPPVLQQQFAAARTVDSGKPDMRGAYGLLGQEMISALTHLQHARGKNVVFVAILDERLDDFNRKVFVPQIEGSKTSLELPGIVDEVVTLAEIKVQEADGSGRAYRAFVTHTVNPYGFPAKDRSGRLDLLEPPHLGALIAKCAGISTSSASATTAQSHESQE